MFLSSKNYYFPIVIISPLLSWLSFPLDLWAHGMRMTQQVHGGQLEVTILFDPDVPAGQAKVRLSDEKKQVIASGQTDSNGCWSCPAPPAGTYKLEVNAGAGHRKRFDITITDQDDLMPPTDEHGPLSMIFRVTLGLGIIVTGSFVVLWFRQKRPQKDQG